MLTSTLYASLSHKILPTVDILQAQDSDRKHSRHVCGSSAAASGPWSPLEGCHKFLEGRANLNWRIFLQEVHSLNPDFSLIRPATAEIQDSTLDDRTRLTRNEQLRNRTLRQPP